MGWSSRSRPIALDVRAIRREVVEEDFTMCRDVQHNLASGFYESGPLSPRHENGVAYFHDLVRHALAPELRDGEPGRS